ncbi:MAG: YkgJ family cysteine cluster protein [Candidatus Lokiarchaeota archaeon]|nr:YkgJ family cysteine cluster protein [Candidatus Lokiarchaeota archaeon]
MSSLLDTIKNHFLRCSVDAGNIDAIEAYQVDIASLDLAGVLASIEALITKPAPLIASIRADLSPIEIDVPVTFTCDRCGRCCSSFRIGISWADINAYLQRGASFIFPCIIVQGDRAYYQLMTKGEFLQARSSFSAARLREVEAINPSLSSVPDEDLQNCVFFDPSNRACTIHELKPLECKTYPAGNIVFKDMDNACDPSCFEHGDRVDTVELARLLDQKRGPDYVLSMAFGIAQPGGWRLDFFKIALLFERCRSAP